MLLFAKNIRNITILSSMCAGLFLITACSKSKLSSSKSQNLQFTFSPSGDIPLSTATLISALVTNTSPTCEDVSDGHGLLFEDTSIDSCVMTINGVDSGSAYEGGFVCNDAQTQGVPLLHLPLQGYVCYGGTPTFVVQVTCTHDGNIIGQGTAKYSCVYP